LLYYVRLMRQEDIAQVTEIDHEAFPTMLPPANYERELQTRLAHYIIAYEGSGANITPEKKPSPVASRIRQLFRDNHRSDSEPSATGRDYIVGFAGFWMMAEEAHLTNIAVRKSYYRRGIGERLLISMIDLALELNARLLTLEVRVSNIAARNLYYKYGFTRGGLRRGYYADNKEDALIMSLEDITSVSFQRRLSQLKKAHSREWGVVLYHTAHTNHEHKGN